MPHPAADPAADPAAVDHAAHDPLLVATYAAGDAAGAELETATALVAACPACAALHHDLRAIAAALPVMPAPPRTRDFRLTAEQAASLRPSGWRRLLAPFAGPRFAFAAPLGSGLAALGLVGILLAGTGLPLGGPTAGTADAEAPLLAAPPAAPLAAAPPTDETTAVASPASAEGQVATTTASDGPDIQGAVPAPEGTAGADAAASGASTAGSDKNAAGANASPEGAQGAAAGTSPSDAPGASAEAVRVMGERDTVSGLPANVAFLALAMVMLVVGIGMAGLRVLSRRVA